MLDPVLVEFSGADEDHDGFTDRAVEDMRPFSGSMVLEAMIWMRSGRDGDQYGKIVKVSSRRWNYLWIASYM